MHQGSGKKETHLQQEYGHHERTKNIRFENTNQNGFSWKSYVLQLGIQVGMSDMTNATLGGVSTASSSFMSGSVPMVDLAELAEATNNWDER